MDWWAPSSSHPKEAQTQSDPTWQFWFWNLLREVNKIRSLMRNRTPQANFHVSQDWAGFWMQKSHQFSVAGAHCTHTLLCLFALSLFMSLFLISMQLDRYAAFQLTSPPSHILKVPKCGLQRKEPKQSWLRLRKHRKQQDVQAILSMERQLFGDNLPVRLQSCSA